MPGTSYDTTTKISRLTALLDDAAGAIARYMAEGVEVRPSLAKAELARVLGVALRVAKSLDDD